MHMNNKVLVLNFCRRCGRHNIIIVDESKRSFNERIPNIDDRDLLKNIMISCRYALITVLHAPVFCFSNNYTHYMKTIAK